MWQLPALGVLEFRRVLIPAIIYAVFGLVVLSLGQNEAIGFLEGFFLIPLIIAPFTGSFGKSLAVTFAAILGTLWGATTMGIIRMPITGSSLAISMALATAINSFVMNQYTIERKRNTVLNAVRAAYESSAGPLYGNYAIMIMVFIISAFFGGEWLLEVAVLLLHNMIASTLILPAGINLYEHYMEKRAITKFEEKLLVVVKEYGTEPKSIPMISSWIGSAIEDVMTGIENLRSKHYIVSGKFFYPSNPLMWFVGVLAPLLGFSLAAMALPSPFEIIALLSSATLLIAGLSLQKSWYLNPKDRFFTHFVGVTAVLISVFFALAISTYFAKIMLLIGILGLIVCYLPEKQINLGRFATALFYTLAFWVGWIGKAHMTITGILYGTALFFIVLTDLFTVREERYMKIK